MARCWRLVKDWHMMAVEMYFLHHGRRCVKCSDPVEKKDAVFYKGTCGEIALVHAAGKCRKVK